MKSIRDIKDLDNNQKNNIAKSISNVLKSEALKLTSHAIQRMKQRKINKVEILRTLKNGEIVEYRKTVSKTAVKLLFKNIAVVLNTKSDEIVTTFDITKQL